MEPTTELTKKVKSATTSEMSEKSLIKWGNLLSSIPCFYTGYTNNQNKELREHFSVVEELHQTVLEAWLRPGLRENDERYIICKFDLENKAWIEKPHLLDVVDELVDKNFYEFNGTWEEVTMKMVEINNILTSIPECTITISK